MTAKNLSTVASDLIGSYGNTAKNVIDVYQAGGERVVAVLEQRWNAALKQSRSQLSTETAKNAANAQAVFSSYYFKGLMQTTKGAQMVVDQLVRLAEAGVERVAANASAFEIKTGISTLNTLAEVSRPGAVMLSQFAAKVEQKSADLADKLAADASAKTAVRRTSAFAERRASKAA